MAKFKYYVTDTTEGMIIGTNSDKEAQDYAASSDYFVVDSTTGEWITDDGERVPV